jgi:hypothetical protein
VVHEIVVVLAFTATIVTPEMTGAEEEVVKV